MANLRLTSPAFDDGANLPREYGYLERNVNPPLRVASVPDDAETLALVMDDPDAVKPAGKVWDHWVVWNVPAGRTEVPEDWSPVDSVEGRNDYGDFGFDGPNPPDGTHTYRFRLFALDTSLDLPADTDADALLAAVEGHVLASADLSGTYAP